MGVLLVAGQAFAGFFSWRNYTSIPVLPRGGQCGEKVSIIIPARNEAERLPRLLASLRTQSLDPFEVIVVDDMSNDSTVEVAESFGARVVCIDSLPAGWTGKPHACVMGARAAGGDWLLFTDADTVHEPALLQDAVVTAQANGLALLSVFAGQRCESFSERLLLPYAYALYFAGAWGVGRSRRPGLANGQYMLFCRDAYWRLGGHAAVRASIIEDVALGGILARTDLPVGLFRAEDRLKVRMYDGFTSLWEGFSKNSFRFITASPRTGLVTVAATLLFNASLPTAIRIRRSVLLAGCAVSIPTISLIPWLKTFGVPLRYAFLHPLAAVVFQILALDSMRRAVTGQATWKGRRY